MSKQTQRYLNENLARLQLITAKCREDMHEPDEQMIEAFVHGSELDNAMGDDPDSGELVVTIKNGATGQVENINLATLIALARKAKIY